MNDSPGWAPPGSSPSDQPDHGDQEQERPETAAPAQGDAGAWGAKWAQRQPPPGRWGAPRASTPTSPPGRGAGWSGTPHAARPGVIPLRPLRVGEILDGSVATMRAHWRMVAVISLAVAVVTQTFATISTGIWFQDVPGLDALDDHPNPTFTETLDVARGALGSSGVTLLIGILGTIISTALLTVVAGRAVLGRPVSIREAWQSARPRLPQMCGLLFLLPLMIAAVLCASVAPGVLLALADAESGGDALAALGGLAGAVVAVWLWIRYSLAAPALMLERQGVIAAMRRSAKLVRGSWWRVCGIQLLAVVIVVVVGAIIEIPTSMVGTLVAGDSATNWLSGDSASVSWSFLIVTAIGGVIGSILTLPFNAGVTALLYMDQEFAAKPSTLNSPVPPGPTATALGPRQRGVSPSR